MSPRRAQTGLPGEARGLAVKFLAALAIWLLVWGVASLLGTSVQIGTVAALVVAATVVGWLFIDAIGATGAPSWSMDASDPVRRPGEDSRLSSLARHLDRNTTAGDSRLLRADLVGVADQQLMAHHGVSRISDPERASRILGPELAALLPARPDHRIPASDNPDRPLTRSEIEALLTRIEAL